MYSALNISTCTLIRGVKKPSTENLENLQNWNLFVGALRFGSTLVGGSRYRYTVVDDLGGRFFLLALFRVGVGSFMPSVLTLPFLHSRLEAPHPANEPVAQPRGHTGELLTNDARKHKMHRSTRMNSSARSTMRWPRLPMATLPKASSQKCGKKVRIFRFNLSVWLHDEVAKNSFDSGRHSRRCVMHCGSLFGFGHVCIFHLECVV